MEVRGEIGAEVKDGVDERDARVPHPRKRPEEVKQDVNRDESRQTVEERDQELPQDISRQDAHQGYYSKNRSRWDCLFTYVNDSGEYCATCGDYHPI